MTKKEYKELLESDYWRGFSYSIIKERNFTCEDCGAYYPNERNKLQVHHLVYRDINPWSYAPNEMVVLCRKCHEKRHGIVHSDDFPSDVIANDNFLVEEDANVWGKIKSFLSYVRIKNNSTEHPKYRVYSYNRSRFRHYRRKQKTLSLYFIIMFLLIWGVIISLDSMRSNKSSTNNVQEYKAVEKTPKQKSKHKKKKSDETQIEIDPFEEIVEPEIGETEVEEGQMTDIQVEPNTEGVEQMLE